MYVLIDDLRDINKMTADHVLDDEKLTIRTFEDGMKYVKFTNLTDITLFMDNDLGTYDGEGYDILSHAIDHSNFPKTIVLVTSNSVALARMKQMLLHSNKYSQLGSIFTRR